MTYNVFGGTLSLTQSINSPELLVDAGVSVVDCELEQRRGDGDILEDGDALLVRTEHGRIVVGVGDSQLDVRDVDVRHVRVLDVHRQVERRIQQRVIVHRLHAHRTSLDACFTHIHNNRKC